MGEENARISGGGALYDTTADLDEESQMLWCGFGVFC